MVHFLPHESSLKLFPQPIVLICDQPPTDSVRTISYLTTFIKNFQIVECAFVIIKITNKCKGFCSCKEISYICCHLFSSSIKIHLLHFQVKKLSLK